MNTIGRAFVVAMIAAVGIAGAETVFAADAYQAGKDAAAVEKKGEEIGEAAAEQGKRIAREAADAAEKIADDFKAGYEDGKRSSP